VFLALKPSICAHSMKVLHGFSPLGEEGVGQVDVELPALAWEPSTPCNWFMNSTNDADGADGAASADAAGRAEDVARLTVGSIVIRVDDLAKQMDFWSHALDYTHRDEPEDDWVVLRPRTGHGPNISLDLRRSEVHLPPRIHLDLYALDQDAEVDRLLALGATRVEWNRPPDADFVTLADPEGNRFDVVQV
jgi:predicted enzyme related to lactoylglutathione lyase